MTSTSDLSLISITENDVMLFNSIVELDQSEFSRPWSDEGWADALESEFKIIHAMVKEGELLGHALWQLSKPEALAHLLKIQIAVQYRGKGYGLHLLDSSENELKKLGFSRFYLEVETENLGAINLYKKKGYQILHSKIRYYDDGKDALFMSKELETE